MDGILLCVDCQKIGVGLTVFQNVSLQLYNNNNWAVGLTFKMFENDKFGITVLFSLEGQNLSLQNLFCLFTTNE